MLTLKALRAANQTRQILWEGSDKADLEFRTIEVAGETGELCEAVKKYLRAARNIQGTTASLADIADEMADVIIAIDLLGDNLHIDLDYAVRQKFNKTSDKYNLDVRL